MITAKVLDRVSYNSLLKISRGGWSGTRGGLSHPWYHSSHPYCFSGHPSSKRCHPWSKLGHPTKNNKKNERQPCICRIRVTDVINKIHWRSFDFLIFCAHFDSSVLLATILILDLYQNIKWRWQASSTLQQKEWFHVALRETNKAKQSKRESS